ncbi:MAG TPA: hypothetical protein VGO67_08370 [Verrucomicrobiae bacterium]|jgi:hypothetical protein
MRIIAAAFGLVVLSYAARANPDAEPANPHANASARAVLEYFHTLSDAQEHRIISGQFSDFGKGASLQAMTNVFK